LQPGDKTISFLWSAVLYMKDRKEVNIVGS